MSFFDYPVGLNQNPEKEEVGEGGYYDPIRPWIKFMDNSGSTTNYIVNSFREDNPLQLTGLETQNGIGEVGGATMHIWDDGNVDEDLINWGNKVVIKLAKNEWEFANRQESTWLIGYVRGYRKHRPTTNVLDHEVTVLGSKVLFTDRKILYKKSTSSSNSEKFQIKNHIREIIKNRGSYPFLGTPDLEEQGGFDLSGINEDLKTFVGKVNFELVEAAGAIQQLADIEGARFFIDYLGEKEIVTVEYPSNLHTGIIVKSGDLKSMEDDANNTSYFMGSWEGSADISSGNGFANRLMTKTQIERKEFTSSFTNKSSTSLTFKAIAQKFFITEPRLSDIGLLLSKVGEPTSQNDRVNGRIIADNNNSPTGNIISEFNIPLSSIEPQPETIFVNDLKIKQKFVETGKPAWIVLYQRSGTEETDKSEPNHDEANTIRWHNNNDTANVTTLVSKTAPSGDRQDDLVWNFSVASDKGPTYGFGVFAEIRHIQELSERGSIARYGRVDGEVDASFLAEPELIQSYLQSLLQFSSRPKIVFATNALKCPNQFLFKPYQVVTLVDTLAYPLSMDVEIQSASYSFSPDSYALGCKDVSVTPMGYYNYKDAQYKCVSI